MCLPRYLPAAEPIKPKRTGTIGDVSCIQREPAPKSEVSEPPAEMLKIAYGAFWWCHADEIELPYRLVSLSDNNFVKVRRVAINCYDTSDIESILNALIK